MAWIDHYRTPHPQDWQGRDDAPPHSSFFQVVKPLNLNELPEDAALNGFAIIGFACDEGIRRNFGRVGAIEGPHAFRIAFAKLPIHRHDCAIYDAGDILCLHQDLETAQIMLGEAVHLLLSIGLTPIIIGGGHELAYGHYQGVIHTINKPYALINFDAHYDMRPLPPEQTGSSGTPFLQIATDLEHKKFPFHYYCLGIQPTGNTDALFNTANSHHVQTCLASVFHDDNKTAITEFMNLIHKNNCPRTVSICLDVFGIQYAPGVSAPQVLGLSPFHVLPLLKQLASSGKVLSYDLAELSPAHDEDHRTAKLAAHLVYDIVHHHQFMPGGSI